ncbi:MAG: ADOP family duplicated permease [Gemmatimonadaceae bacterium]
MTLREVLGRLLAWRRRDALDAQLAEDIEVHVELLARDLAAGGMTPGDALTAARRQVGNATSLRERTRDVWGFPWLEAIVQDLRYGLRGLRRSPGFTATVIITLGLGIGANAAIFGVIDRVMFRPFPYMRAPSEVNRIYLQSGASGHTSVNTTFPWRRYVDLQAASVGTFAAQSEWRFAVGSGEAAQVRRVSGVSASLFSFYDIVPVRGRWFSAAEDAPPAGSPVAIISYGMWVSAYGSADVLGRQLKVGSVDYTIIGVAPPDFVAAVAGGPPDVIVPITSIPANLGTWATNSYLSDYSWDWVQVFVRRKRGLSERAASLALTDAYKRSRTSARALNPRVQPDSIARPLAIAGPMKQAAGPQAGPEARVLLWVTGVALIVLLIACANVANLMFARVLKRRREVSVRLALGVRRGRLIGQFLVEGLVLALLGCAAGLFVAQWGGAAIRALLLPDSSTFTLADDWCTLGVAAACATVAALLTTIGPALMATSSNLAASLKAGVREGTHARSPARAALVVIQGALSIVLLVGAGLFVRSFNNARSVPLGYDVAPVLEVIPDYRGNTMDSATAAVEHERLLAVARSMPGVESAARVNSRLFGTNTLDLRVDGIDSVAALGRFNFQTASPEYFAVMKTRILRGRAFDASDRAESPPVVVVSEAMARTLWPGKDALGECIHIGLGPRKAGEVPPEERAPCTTVIGVAENTVQQNIGDDPRFMYYLPLTQTWPHVVSTMYLRMSSRDAAGQIERVRRELTRVMPGDGVVVIRPLQEVVDDQSRSWRLGATLFAAFGALALVVAIVGLYGVISYDVAQRAHELGVRVALGATARDIVDLVVRQGMQLGVFGIGAGLAMALIASRWVQPLLFRLSARDPGTYGLVGLAMLLAAFAASVVPALRAQRVDPNTALRTD